MQLFQPREVCREDLASLDGHDYLIRLFGLASIYLGSKYTPCMLGDRLSMLMPEPPQRQQLSYKVAYHPLNQRGYHVAITLVHEKLHPLLLWYGSHWNNECDQIKERKLGHKLGIQDDVEFVQDALVVFFNKLVQFVNHLIDQQQYERLRHEQEQFQARTRFISNYRKLFLKE